jgi:glucose-6-phosphate 1-dehydrogenase
MAEQAQVFGSPAAEGSTDNPRGAPCVMVIFGAGGDVTKRLMMPAIYNLACDELLPDQFAIVGADLAEMTDEQFRVRMSDEKDGIRKFHTRKQFDEKVWDWMRSRLYYVQAKDLDGYKKLLGRVKELQGQYKTGDHMMFYFAVAPKIFGLISGNLVKSGFAETTDGWRRIIVEKPFGTDLKSALALNKEILGFWREDQIYRVDHYLGKETVQNLLAFRFSNGMYEPLWNNKYIDHIQFTVDEMVDVEDRGDYYDHSGVLRDMMQNHMFQMLAYLCMEPPASFEPDAIRNEKSKLLQSVKIYNAAEVAKNTVRGQYGKREKIVSKKGGAPGEVETVTLPSYRESKGVDPKSRTETFAAAKLLIDNWRWSGVPFYLRSGKALWKRGTEIVVQFKKAPAVIFKGTPVHKVGANRLIFHIQPFQGIETLFQAKIPGPMTRLQTVHMRFSYGDTFKASRYTGYEVMVYSCMNGDATLFSRTDLVETAWKIAQPILDYWQSTEPEFPNYTRGSWGPKAATKLIENDGRRWFEVVTADVLEQTPIFKGADPLLLNSVLMALRPATAEAGEMIVKKGDIGEHMYLICRGEVEVLDGSGKVLRLLKDGDIFGEISVLLGTPRTATVRAKELCDLFVLDKADIGRILHDYPQFAEGLHKVAQDRHDQLLKTGNVVDSM